MDSKEHILFIHVNENAPYASSDTIPLSEAYILATLKSQGFDGSILVDCLDRPLDPMTLEDVLREKRPFLLGFNTYQENIHKVRLWARFAKRICPEIKIILGGPQATFMPGEALLQMKEIDFICRGEGEQVMLALSSCLQRNGNIKEEVQGICLLCGDEPINTPPSPAFKHLKDLDHLPSPYLMNIIDLKGKEQAMLLTSRGCPFNCLFCYTPRATRKRIRFHSIGRVIEEIRYLQTKGIQRFWFADPNFSYSRDRMIELLEAIIDHCPGIGFWCQTRYDLVDQKLLALLKRAGAITVAYGLESADPEVLGRISKGLDPDRLRQVIAMTQAQGINVELFTLYGLPGETFSQAQKTLSYVKENQVSIQGNSISQQLHLFFGAPITDDPPSHGIRPLPYTRPAYLSVCREFETATMTRDEIRRMSLLWYINRNEFFEDVESGVNLFERANFLSAYWNEIGKVPEARYLMARIYLALEEYQLALVHYRFLETKYPNHPLTKRLSSYPAKVFRIVNRKPAAIGHKVLFDCEGFDGERSIPATKARFMSAVLGDGSLISDFEKGLLGLRPRRWTEFQVTFPQDYFNDELAGRNIRFQVFLHHVLMPVNISTLSELEEKAPKNIYRIEDLSELQRHNENLYYLVLKETSLSALQRDMGLTDYLNLIGYRLKLGIKEKALEMASHLPPDPSIIEHVSGMLRASGLIKEALELIDKAGASSPGLTLRKAQCLYDQKRWHEAEKVASTVWDFEDIELLDLRVRLSSRLGLSVKEYLARTDELLDAQLKQLCTGASPYPAFTSLIEAPV